MVVKKACVTDCALCVFEAAIYIHLWRLGWSEQLWATKLNSKAILSQLLHQWGRNMKGISNVEIKSLIHFLFTIPCNYVKVPCIY
jgi:hypothetical protein